MPVEPDVLLAKLEAYSKALPVIKALRLCHQSAEGSLNKLPIELRDKIELLLFKDQVRSLRYRSCDFQRHYKCFEDRCAPRDHTDTKDYMTWEEEGWNATLPKCDDCARLDEYYGHPDACDDCSMAHDRALSRLVISTGAGWEIRHQHIV